MARKIENLYVKKYVYLLGVEGEVAAGGRGWLGDARCCRERVGSAGPNVSMVSR